MSSIAQKYKHRLPLGAKKLQKKLGGFVKRIAGGPMKGFKVIDRTIVEYETESGEKGFAELYQDATKKWRFREIKVMDDANKSDI